MSHVILLVRKSILILRFIFFLFVFNASLHAASPIDDPCGGPNALLNLINRPTYADSACVVPNKSELLELGTQYQSLIFQGTSLNLPEAMFRIGLPANNEIMVLFPNYYHQSVSPRAGFTNSALGWKHQFGYDARGIYAAEVYIEPPGGNEGFGSPGIGALANGIISYSITDSLSVMGLFGVSTQTLPSLYGGGRFSSFNPDIIVSWTINRTMLYGEIFGQSKTAPDAGSGFNMDAGLLYLLSKNWVADVEVGQRLSGNLGGFNHYIGAGVSVYFP